MTACCALCFCDSRRCNDEEGGIRKHAHAAEKDVVYRAADVKSAESEAFALSENNAAFETDRAWRKQNRFLGIFITHTSKVASEGVIWALFF